MNNIILIIGVLVVFTILFLFVTLKIRRIILNMNNIKGFINVVIDNNVKELENAVHVLRIYINSMTAELNHTYISNFFNRNFTICNNKFNW